MLRGLIVIAHSAQSQTPPDEHDLALLEKSWEYACGDIPTGYLDECFKRALRAKRDNYPLNAVEVNTAYEELKEDMRVERLRFQGKVLPSGRNGESGGLVEYLSFAQWKAKHSPDNPEHDEARCAICRERKNKGLPLPYEIRGMADFGGFVGTGTEGSRQAERSREHSRFERALRPPPEGERFGDAAGVDLFDDDEDPEDLPF